MVREREENNNARSFFFIHSAQLFPFAEENTLYIFYTHIFSCGRCFQMSMAHLFYVRLFLGQKLLLTSVYRMVQRHPVGAENTYICKNHLMSFLFFRRRRRVVRQNKMLERIWCKRTKWKFAPKKNTHTASHRSIVVLLMVECFCLFILNTRLTHTTAKNTYII